MLKIIIASISILICIAGCGGGSNGDSNEINRIFSGNISGTDCFGGFPVSQSVTYKINFSDSTPGSEARLSDLDDNSWQGSIGESRNLEVRLPSGDKRYLIQASDVLAKT